MHQSASLFLASIVLLTACSNGGGSPRSPATPSGGDLTGTWALAAQVLEVDGPCPQLAIENAVGQVALLADDPEPIYTLRLDGVEPRPLGPLTASVQLVHHEESPALVMVVGVYYDPTADATVELTSVLDAPQLAEAAVTDESFVTLVDFEVWEGDAMVAEDTDGDGFQEWTIAAGVPRLCGGRLRMTADLR